MRINGERLVREQVIPLSLTTNSELGKASIETTLRLHFDGDYGEARFANGLNLGRISRSQSVFQVDTELIVLTKDEQLPKNLEVDLRCTGCEVSIDPKKAVRNQGSHHGHSFSIPATISINPMKFTHGKDFDFLIAWSGKFQFEFQLDLQLCNYFVANNKPKLVVPIMHGTLVNEDIKLESVKVPATDFQAEIVGFPELKMIAVDQSAGRFRLEFRKSDRRFAHGDRFEAIIRISALRENQRVEEDLSCDVILIGSIDGQ
jgi:hypothetical protein